MGVEPFDLLKAGMLCYFILVFVTFFSQLFGSTKNVIDCLATSIASPFLVLKLAFEKVTGVRP